MASLTVGKERAKKPDAENDMFQKIFLTALLFTGSAVKAECAILNGISTLGQGGLSCNDLLDATLRAALAPQRAIRLEPSQTSDRYISSLPVELRRVLLLPEHPRHCFVLHRLVGLPLPECSRMLLLSGCEVEQKTISATLALVAFAVAEQAAAYGGFDFPSGGHV